MKSEIRVNLMTRARFTSGTMIKGVAVMRSRKNTIRLGSENTARRVKNKAHVIRTPQTLSERCCIITAIIVKFKELPAEKLEGFFILKN